MEAKLSKYAYYIGKRAGCQDEWKITDSELVDLRLCLSGNHHLIVWQDKKIMENVSLWNSNSWMKAIAKGDSMLFVSKYQGAHRRFRVKFSDKEKQGAGDVRKTWCERLRKYFTVSEIDTADEEGASQKEEELKAGKLQDQAAVGCLAKVLCSEVKSSLPAIYQQTELPTQSLETLVSLCLTDVNFPAFVEAVDKQLNSLLEKPA